MKMGGECGGTWQHCFAKMVGMERRGQLEGKGWTSRHETMMGFPGYLQELFSMRSSCQTQG